MTDFFTADLHFGHDMMIERFQRPFRDVAHMDQVMMQNLNDTVGPEDDLWILGDFTWGRPMPKARVQALFDQLPGARRHLIIGNRDHQDVLDLSWDSIAEMAEMTLQTQSGQSARFVLCHYPMLTWPQAAKGVRHMFGHVHSNWSGSDRAINLGVDLWDFMPVTVDQILQRAAGLAPHPLFDQLEQGERTDREI